MHTQKALQKLKGKELRMIKLILLFLYITASLHGTFELPENFSQLPPEKQKEIEYARDFALFNQNMGEKFEEIERLEKQEALKNKRCRFLCCFCYCLNKK